MFGQTLDELNAEYNRLTAEYDHLANERNQAQTAYEQQSNVCDELQ
jgi:archaellum component FlaC